MSKPSISPLTRESQPRHRHGRYAGAALHDARRNKERVYLELTRGGRCRLVVLGIETGGRWSEEACTFLRLLAQHRARQATPLLRQAVAAALLHRWSAMLSPMRLSRSMRHPSRAWTPPHKQTSTETPCLLASSSPTTPPPTLPNPAVSPPSNPPLGLCEPGDRPG